MSKYNTTFHFYYEDCTDACQDYAKLKKSHPNHELKLNFTYNDDNKKFWFIHLIIKDLTTLEVTVWDVLLKERYKWYDGWDVDTKNPNKTIEEFGYVV